MKVNLIKEANYELNENKSSKIPFDTFIKMCGATTSDNSNITAELPDARIFASIEEFKALPSNVVDKFDTTKDVYVLSNGNFCVFLKGESNTVDVKSVTPKQVVNNATTNTKKNTESEPTDLV